MKVDKYSPKWLLNEIRCARNDAHALFKILEFQKAIMEQCLITNTKNDISPEQMAEWFHNNYEEIAREEGWQTQDKCRVEFKDLPEKNKTTMIKVCARWLNVT